MCVFVCVFDVQRAVSGAVAWPLNMPPCLQGVVKWGSSVLIRRMDNIQILFHGVLSLQILSVTSLPAQPGSLNTHTQAHIHTHTHAFNLNIHTNTHTLSLSN